MQDMRMYKIDVKVECISGTKEEDGKQKDKIEFVATMMSPNDLVWLAADMLELIDRNKLIAVQKDSGLWMLGGAVHNPLGDEPREKEQGKGFILLYNSVLRFYHAIRERVGVERIACRGDVPDNQSIL